LIEIRAAERGRAKLASLTPSGRERLDEAMPHWTRVQEMIVAPFGPERWKELEAALRALAAPAAQD
jgi:DNA-binding MarR family transcriptional regulator